MPQQVKLWAVNADGNPQHVEESRLALEERLEEWIEADISLVDDQLLVIGRQVATDFGGLIDLLSIDASGDLVVLELKRHRTPREVTAQAMDYASWVVDLSHERISKIADDYFGRKGALETEFRRRFSLELPETVNGNHRIVIVASEIDASSERIIDYLSRHHGVNINAVTFQYFSAPLQGDIVARVFLLEPEEVEYKARTKGGSKRKPNLTYDELREVAEENGVGDIYEKIVELLRPLFDGIRTTRSSVSFVGPFRGGKSAMLNLIPTESSESDGLKYQAYSLKLAEYLGIEEKNVGDLLPPGAQPWKYAEGSEWEGFTGYVTAPDQLQALVKVRLSPDRSARDLRIEQP